MTVKTSIQWTDICINPITGCSNFGNKDVCGSYCYAARMAKRLAGRFGYPADDPFRPAFHPERICEITWNHARPTKIFLNSMSDWFNEGVNPDWIREVLEAVSQNRQDTFFVLTKRPENMCVLHCFSLELLELPSNLWWGVSVTSSRDTWRIRKLIDMLPREVHKFVSFEPLHGPVDPPDLDGIEWVIIGGETGSRKGKIRPKMEWVEGIFRCLPEGVPVFMKDNLGPDLMPTGGFIQQLPEVIP